MLNYLTYLVTNFPLIRVHSHIFALIRYAHVCLKARKSQSDLRDADTAVVHRFALNRRLYILVLSISNKRFISSEEKLMLQRCALILLTLTVAAAGQTKTTTTTPAKRKTAAKTTTTSTGPPTAIIHTTAGTMKCELFPDKAP